MGRSCWGSMRGHYRTNLQYPVGIRNGRNMYQRGLSERMRVLGSIPFVTAAVLHMMKGGIRIYGAMFTGSIRRSVPASSSVSRYNSPSGPCFTSRIRCLSSVRSGCRRIGSPFVGLRTMRCS